MLSEEFVPVAPVHYFQFRLDCPYLKPGKPLKLEEPYTLPDLTKLCTDDHFADVALGWNQEGIHAHVHVSEKLHESFYPQVEEGDGFELFLDTRDVKTSGFNTRFCHHFFFLPDPVDVLQAGEKTHFRTDDRHEHCDPHDLKLTTKKKGESYTMQIFIPAHCMHGYDPEQFDRMGMAYRVNRVGYAPQHFCASSEDYTIEQQPSLWCSMRLAK